MAKSKFIIDAKRPHAIANLIELWRYRQLLGTFALRDYKARYAQTILGWFWGLLQPLLSIAVLYLVFQRVLRTDTAGIPFFPFALSGLLFWTYFSFVINQSASSLISAQAMLQKVFFPRGLLPLSKALLGLVDLGVALVIFVIWTALNTQWNAVALAFFPLLLMPVIFGAWGLGLWVSALSIRYRDIQQIVPLILQLLFFLTPVAYAPELLSSLLGDFQALIYLNPVTGAIEIFRALAFGLPLNPLAYLSLIWALLLLVSGWWYFIRVERKIADWI